MHAYTLAVEMNRKLRPVAELVGRHDRDLLVQLRRAATSVVLNLAEGNAARGGNRRLRFESALGSARETLACLHVAEAWGYVGPEHSPALDATDHVIAVLVRLVHAVR